MTTDGIYSYPHLKAMTTDEIWVRILIYNDCGTEKFLNVFFPVKLSLRTLYGRYGDQIQHSANVKWLPGTQPYTMTPFIHLT